MLGAYFPPETSLEEKNGPTALGLHSLEVKGAGILYHPPGPSSCSGGGRHSFMCHICRKKGTCPFGFFFFPPLFIKKTSSLPRANHRAVFLSHLLEVFIVTTLSCKRGWETEHLFLLLAERGRETYGSCTHHRCPLQCKQLAGDGPVCPLFTHH